MFKKEFKQSIQFKFFSVMLIILSISTFVLSIVIPINEKTVLKNSLVAHGQSRASFIAKLSKDPLLMKDAIQLDTIVNEANKDEDFIYTVIQDTQGKLLTSQYASINYQWPRIKAILSGLSRDSELRDIINDIKEKEPVIELSVPIMIDIKPIGTVTVGMSGYRINQQVIKTILFVIGLNLVVALVLGVTLYIASRKIILDPISELANAASCLAKGDLSTKVKIKAIGEIQMLVNSFNQMADDLNKTTVSRDYVDNILHTMHDNLFVITMEGKIKSVNASVCTLLGYKEEELLEEAVESLFPQNSLFLEEMFEKTLKESTLTNQQTSLLSRDGREIPVLFSSSLMHSNNADGQRIVCVAVDITERIKTEKELADTQKQLIDAAHKAGMADIATGILHNFGNVLNSVNSSAEEIHNVLNISKVQSFIKANKLLKEHMDHIDEFLTKDEKGRRLPEFYLKLGAVLKEEYDKIRKGMSRIENKIATMKGIIETQQEYARAEFNSDKEDLTKIINEVLKIQKDLIDSSGAKITSDYQDAPRCKVHKYKLVQVILNLVKNAVEAMKGNDLLNKPKELRIETGPYDERHDFIRIIDNGCGIPEENLIKIFNHGFTTKEKGHGFGLHSSANALSEMGGSINVESEGENRGATFTIKLPVLEKIAHEVKVS